MILEPSSIFALWAKVPKRQCTCPLSLGAMWSRASPAEAFRDCCVQANWHRSRNEVWLLDRSMKLRSLVSELFVEPKPTESSALKTGTKRTSDQCKHRHAQVLLSAAGVHAGWRLAHQDCKRPPCTDSTYRLLHENRVSDAWRCSWRVNGPKASAILQECFMQRNFTLLTITIGCRSSASV